MMNLVQLINYFRNGGSYLDFCQSHSLDKDSEVIEIYMERPFHLDKNLEFFEIEKTEGNLVCNIHRIEYVNLFDFYFFLDAIEESNNQENKLLSDNQIAQKLLNYARHDS